MMDLLSQVNFTILVPIAIVAGLIFVFLNGFKPSSSPPKAQKQRASTSVNATVASGVPLQTQSQSAKNKIKQKTPKAKQSATAPAKSDVAPKKATLQKQVIVNKAGQKQKSSVAQPAAASATTKAQVNRSNAKVKAPKGESGGDGKKSKSKAKAIIAEDGWETVMSKTDRKRFAETVGIVLLNISNLKSDIKQIQQNKKGNTNTKKIKDNANNAKKDAYAVQNSVKTKVAGDSGDAPNDAEIWEEAKFLRSKKKARKD